MDYKLKRSWSDYLFKETKKKKEKEYEVCLRFGEFLTIV